MIEAVNLKRYNLNLINYGYIYKNHIEIPLLNDLHRFQLFPLDLSHKDTKRICYHYLIQGLCNYVLLHKQVERNVIVFNQHHSFNTSESKNFISVKELSDFVTPLNNKLQSILPIVFYNHQNSFIVLLNQIKNKTGEGVQCLNEMSQLIQQTRLKDISYDKIFKLTKKYDLRKLNAEFFKNLQNSRLIF